MDIRRLEAIRGFVAAGFFLVFGQKSGSVQEHRIFQYDNYNIVLARS